MLQIWRPRNANLSAADVSKNMANAFKDISVGTIVSELATKWQLS